MQCNILKKHLAPSYIKFDGLCGPSAISSKIILPLVISNLRAFLAVAPSSQHEGRFSPHPKFYKAPKPDIFLPPVRPEQGPMHWSGLTKSFYGFIYLLHNSASDATRAILHVAHAVAWTNGPQKRPTSTLGRHTTSTFHSVDGTATSPTPTLVVFGKKHGFAIACQGTYTRHAMALVPNMHNGMRVPISVIKYPLNVNGPEAVCFIRTITRAPRCPTSDVACGCYSLRPHGHVHIALRG